MMPIAALTMDWFAFELPFPERITFERATRTTAERDAVLVVTQTRSSDAVSDIAVT